MIFELAYLIQLAFCAVGFTFVARALTPITWRLIKPLSCSLCMAWWPCFILGSSFALSAASSWTEFFLWAPHTAMLVFGATGMAYLWNKCVDLIAFQID